MANGKVFCAYPYVSLFVSNSGKQLPCCYAQNNHTSETPAPNILKSKNTQDLWNSDYIRTIRALMAEGKFPAACSVCEKTEALRGKSHRHRSLDQFAEELESLVEDRFYVKSPIRHLDLRLGNKCNLACRMCHPASSNQLIPEWLMSKEVSERKEAQDVMAMPQWSRSESALELLKSDIVDPTFIHFAGGEPSIDKRHEKVLEHLVEMGKSKKIILSYNTNLTQKISALRFVERFRKIKITVSLDGVGALNDYIRAPSNWNQLNKNLLDYVELSESSEKVQVEANVTLSAYNILAIKSIIKYFASLSVQKPIVPVFTIVEDPNWLSFRVLPPELRLRADMGLQEALNIYCRLEENELLKERLQVVRDILKAAVWDDQLFEKFCEKTEFFDRSRGVSVFDVIPDWREHWRRSPMLEVLY